MHGLRFEVMVRVGRLVAPWLMCQLALVFGLVFEVFGLMFEVVV